MLWKPAGTEKDWGRRSGEEGAARPALASGGGAGGRVLDLGGGQKRF